MLALDRRVEQIELIETVKTESHKFVKCYSALSDCLRGEFALADGITEIDHHADGKPD